MFYLQDLAFRNESGLTGNPLKITWLEGQPEPASHVNSPADVFCSSQVEFYLNARVLNHSPRLRARDRSD